MQLSYSTTEIALGTNTSYSWYKVPLFLNLGKGNFVNLDLLNDNLLTFFYFKNNYLFALFSIKYRY